MKNVKQRMIEDMKLRAMAPRTQDRYVHAIKALAEHYHRPLDKITEKNARKEIRYWIAPLKLVRPAQPPFACSASHIRCRIKL